MVIPAAGRISVSIICPLAEKVTIYRRPDIKSVLGCNGLPVLVEFPDARKSADALQIVAKPTAHWTVAVGLEAKK